MGFLPQTGIPGVDGVAGAVNGAIDSITNAVKGIQGKPSTLANSDDPRKIAKIEADRWDKNYVYTFSIVKADPDGSVTSTTGKDANSNFDLALNPQAIAISTPFAITTTATNRGVLEEHNGVVFRTISISGTTGIYPDRLSNKQAKAGGLLSLSGLFPAATQAFSALGKIASSVFSDTKRPDQGDIDTDKTGYAQYWALNNFLVRYAEMKKKPGNSDYRLIFNSAKDNMAYVCTPVAMDGRRDASQPMMYRYSIVLRAWDLGTGGVTGRSSFIDALNPDNSIKSIKDILERIRRGRRAINQASNVVKAVQSDIGDVLNGINQVVLAGKDVVGLAAEVVDFLPTMISNIRLLARTTASQFVQAANDFTDATHRYSLGPQPSQTPVGIQPAKTGQQTSAARQAQLANPNSAEALIAAKAVSKAAATTSKSGGPTGESIDADSDVPAANAKVITQILADVPVVDQMEVSQLEPLPPAVEAELLAQIATAQQITTGNVSDLADRLQEVSDNLAYATGGMDPVYAQTYGLPAPAAVPDRQVTEDDIVLAASIQGARDAMVESISFPTLFQNSTPDPFTAANDALSQEDQIPSPISGYPILVQGGASLDLIAQQYLGDPNRAREIAIFNDLRAPYIDENGFDQAISLAQNKTFVVTNVDNLTFMQTVVIHATGLSALRRRIINIEKLGPGDFRITVDGSVDLNAYTADKSPYIHSRLPGTIGSGDTILIPSEDQPSDAYQDRSTPLQERMTFAEKLFKVDLLLDPLTGDLAVGPSGDIGLSFGYQNAVQAIRLLLETELGELEQHQDFGLNANVGARTSDLSVSDLTARVKTAVLADPRFRQANVIATFSGSLITIRVEVVGAAGSGLIPVEFQIGLR